MNIVHYRHYSFNIDVVNLIFMVILAFAITAFTGCQKQENRDLSTAKRTVDMVSETFANAITTDQTVAVKKAEKESCVSDSKKDKKADLTTITISAAGDCTFGSDYKSPASVNFYAVYNEKNNPSYFFKNVKKFFAKDDLTLVNLEGTLTKRTTRSDKTYAFRGDPSYVKILKKASIEAVSFANNHCQDFGQGSYTDTIDTLKNAEIKYSSYDKVSIFKAKGIKIGMISVNGLNGYSSSQEYISSGMKKLRKRKANLVIVSIHAGVEHTSLINRTQIDLAHYAIEQGANLVIGHHPHVLQGIERYKGAYIVYSLGNFCFGGNTNPADKDTMIFQQTFTFSGNKLLKKKSKAKVISCCISSTTFINNYQPTPLKRKEKERVIDRLNTYSSQFGIGVKKTGVLYIKK